MPSYSKGVILLLVLFVHSIFGKGLYSGVPCHRAYYCIIGEMNDYYEDSQLVGEVEGIEDEKTCQDLCSTHEDCVSYTWWNAKAVEHPDGKPYLCQMFAVCYRNWNHLNPKLTPVYSGPSECRNPVIVFGGIDENRFAPKSVETIWPPYDDKSYDGLYSYVTLDNFDPIPDIPELGYHGPRFSTAVLLNRDLILSCGGGYGGSSKVPPDPFSVGTATAKCFGLDLVKGSWKPMASMNYPRAQNFTLLNVGNEVLAIGGVRSGLPLIEVYDRDLDFWTPIPEWNDPLDPWTTGHCAVAIDDHQIMVVGGIEPWSWNTSKILDINTGEWRKTAPYPNNGYTLHQSCLATTINGIQGVLVTGGLTRIEEQEVYYYGLTTNQTNFYQIETDSWITLADTWYPVYNHGMVNFQNKPMILGGDFLGFINDEIQYSTRVDVKRNRGQIYQASEDQWSCCNPSSLNYKRSNFAAVSVEIHET